MLWNSLVAASEWVVSIFGATGRLYVTDVSTVMEGCMIKRIKQYFIQECSTWIEIRKRYIPCKWFGESVDHLILRDHVLLSWRLNFRMS